MKSQRNLTYIASNLPQHTAYFTQKGTGFSFKFMS